MAQSDWFTHSRDSEGPIIIDVDRSWADQAPLATHTHRLHVRTQIARTKLRKALRPVTTTLLAHFAEVDPIFVGRAYRPEDSRLTFVFYVPAKRAKKAHRLASNLNDTVLSPATLVDAPAESDPEWDFYSNVLLPTRLRRDYKAAFPTSKAAAGAAEALEQLGHQVDEPQRHGVWWHLAFRVECDGQEQFDALVDLVDSFDGEIVGSGSCE